MQSISMHRAEPEEYGKSYGHVLAGLQVGCLGIYEEGCCSTCPFGQILRHVCNMLKERPVRGDASSSGSRNKKQENERPSTQPGQVTPRWRPEKGWGRTEK